MPSENLSFYSSPDVYKRMKDWHDSMRLIDSELQRLQVLERFTSDLVADLFGGDRVLSIASRKSGSLGQVPRPVIEKVKEIKWVDGSAERIAHLQVIWRYYLLFEKRRLMKALENTLVDRIFFGRYELARVLAALRGIQTVTYDGLRELGLDPVLLDQMLDQPVDFVEWLFELRMWHYISEKKPNPKKLLEEGLYDWWLEERNVAATVTNEPSRPIGNTQVAFSDRLALQHSIHDTKCKYMVMIGRVCGQPEIFVPKLSNRLVQLAMEADLDTATKERTVAAIQIALNGDDAPKFDEAAGIAMIELGKSA